MQILAPIYQPFCLATKSDANSIAFVFSLGGLQNPFAVAGTVPQFIIDALNCVLGAGAVAHVGKEVFKRFPSIAHSYSTLAVISERVIAWIIASVSHARPNAEFRCTSQAVGKVQVLNCMAAALASARSSIVTHEIASRHFNGAPAIASTKPKRFLCPAIAQITAHGQVVITESGTVDKAVSVGYGKELNVGNVNIESGHLGFTSYVKFQLVRLCGSVNALCGAVSILPRRREIHQYVKPFREV